MGCQLESSMCHCENAIDEEGNRKLPHKVNFPRENSATCLWFLLRLKSSMLSTIDEEGNGKLPQIPFS